MLTPFVTVKALLILSQCIIGRGKQSNHHKILQQSHLLVAPLKLSIEERYVIGGWVIEQDREHKLVGADSIRSFVADSFHETVSPAWVTRTMHSLHLTSHREIGRASCTERVSSPV